MLALIGCALTFEHYTHWCLVLLLPGSVQRAVCDTWKVEWVGVCSMHTISSTTTYRTKVTKYQLTLYRNLQPYHRKKFMCRLQNKNKNFGIVFCMQVSKNCTLRSRRINNARSRLGSARQKFLVARKIFCNLRHA